MRKLYQQRQGVVRVVTCGLPGNPKMTLIADDKRILCCQHWQDGKWEPVQTQDERPSRKSIDIAEVINRL